jgi:23S rRNA G2445 N2-methylase RlmL
MTEHGYTSAPNGHQAFSEDQLAEFRQALLREQKEELQRQALMQYQIETLRKSEAAAKQFIQRAKKNGESLEEMTRNLIISGRGRGRKS